MKGRAQSERITPTPTPTPSPACAKNDITLFSIPTTLASIPFVLFLALDFMADTTLVSSSSAVQASIYVLFIAVLAAPPLTHALAGWYATTAGQYELWQPFVGGAGFVLLQMVAWIAYGLSIVLAFVFVYYVGVLNQPLPFDGLIGLVGGVGLLSQLALLWSLGYFSSSHPSPSPSAAPGPSPPLPRRFSAKRSHSSPALRRTDSADYRVRLSLSSDNSNGPPSELSDSDLSIQLDDDVDDDELDLDDDLGSPLLSPILGRGRKPRRSWMDGRWNTVGTFTLLMACVSAGCFVFLEYSSNRAVVDDDSGTYLVHVGPDSVPGYALPVGVLAAVLLITAAPLTHGMVGSRKYRNVYRFYQPFQGGSVFVLLQALGWSMYGLFLALSLYVLYLFVTEVDIVGGLITSVGTAGLVAQILLFASMFWYRYEPTTVSSSSFLGTSFTELAKDIWSFVIVNALFQFPLVESAIIFIISYAFHSRGILILGIFLSLVAGSEFAFALLCMLSGVLHTPGLLVITFGFIMYWHTYRGDPHVTGARRWEWFCSRPWLWSAVSRYFRATVLGKSLSPDETYMFGFHPHGIYPLTCIWLGLCNEWKKAQPGISFSSLAATIVCRTPFMRDVVLWSGVRDVSRRTISMALEEKTSVMLVPGGQAEMFLHTDDPNIVRVVTRHKGFVRMAIQTGTPLVPVFSFGENQIMSNVHAPDLQAWTVKHLGFGFPHFPMGRFYSSMPCPSKISVAVGDPVRVPHIPRHVQLEMDAEDLTAIVNTAHHAYYTALLDVFETYKAEAGHPDAVLELVPPLAPLPPHPHHE